MNYKLHSSNCFKTINTSVIEVTFFSIPRIPVIVCDGSGRAADILAFAHQAVSQNGLVLGKSRTSLFLIFLDFYPTISEISW